MAAGAAHRRGQFTEFSLIRLELPETEQEDACNEDAVL